MLLCKRVLRYFSISLLFENMGGKFVLPWLLWLVFWTTNAARLKDVNFEPGDIVDTSMILNVFYPWIPLKPPFHRMFALSRNEVLQIEPFNVQLDTLNWAAKVEIITLREYFEFPTNYQYAEKMKPDPAKGPIGRNGVIIARRMEGMTIPYNALYCNCYHYADYFAYGQTFGAPLGTKWSVYFSVSDDCPLHRRILPDTNVSAKDFVLWDKNRKPFKLRALKSKQD